MRVYLVIEDEPSNTEYPSIVLDAYQDEADARARVTEQYARAGREEGDETTDDDDREWKVETCELLTPEQAGSKLAELAAERRRQQRQKAARRLRALRARRRSISEEIKEIADNPDPRD